MKRQKGSISGIRSPALADSLRLLTERDALCLPLIFFSLHAKKFLHKFMFCFLPTFPHSFCVILSPLEENAMDEGGSINPLPEKAEYIFAAFPSLLF